VADVKDAVGRGRAAPVGAALAGVAPEDSEWRFAEGDEIRPGLTALELLGGGYRYEAYLAWDSGMRSLVVAKLIRPGLVDDERARRGLANEVEVLDALDHPVLIRGFDAELEGDRPHVVLEHVEGPRLSSLLRRYGPLPADQLIPLALQLLSAAHYMAGSGYVHLDVKPSNIIMAGPPRLIDMSLARTLGRAAELEEPIGTDTYMAPEQIRAEPGSIGPPADVWGIGATLYRALAGELPYPDGDEDAETPHVRWPQLREPITPPPPSLPSELTAPIMDALRFDPSDRPAAGELADRLEPLLESLANLRISRLKPRLRQRPRGLAKQR
jgi:serine/threonine protein kinase